MKVEWSENIERSGFSFILSKTDSSLNYILAWQNGEMERNIDLLQERIEKTLLESLSMEMAQLREEIKIADK